VGLTRRQHQPDRQTIGVHECMNLVGQSAPGPSHGPSSIAVDAGTVLKEVDDQMMIARNESVEVNPVVFWIASVVGLAIAYLFGSTPTGYLAGKLLKGIDIREHGSKSIGATNVLRTLGKWPALVVLLVDVLKGVGAIVFARWFYPWFDTLSSVTPPTALDLQTWVPWAVCLAGLAVLLGHSRSIWLNFTGGKSAATGLGVLLAISWPVGLGAATIFGVVLAIFRIVSLSSMLAALTAIALICGLEQPLPYRLLVIAGSIYVIVRHRANIQRLLAGTEPRLGQSSPESQAESQI
jgi:acyl phosphate:glycerol-3-phosphate acyltransferase